MDTQLITTTSCTDRITTTIFFTACFRIDVLKLQYLLEVVCRGKLGVVVRILTLPVILVSLSKLLSLKKLLVVALHCVKRNN